MSAKVTRKAWRLAATLIIFVVSLVLFIPSLFWRRLWRYQNQIVDWVFDHEERYQEDRRGLG